MCSFINKLLRVATENLYQSISELKQINTFLVRGKVFKLWILIEDLHINRSISSLRKW